VLRVAATVGAIALGLVFLVAGLAKVVDPEAFAEVVKAEGLDVVVSAMVVALLAIALEVGLGLALALGLRTRRVLAVSTVLVVGFLFLTGRAYVHFLRGDAPAVHSCGCFGNLVDRSPAAAFWQDVAMLVPALVLAWLAPLRADGPARTRRWITVAAATLGSVALGIAAPSLPLDGIATRLHEGDSVKEICTSAGRKRVCLTSVLPDLATGRHVVVLADLDDAGFRAAVPELNAYAADGKGPRLLVLAAVGSDDVAAFCLTAGATCPLMAGPVTLLRPLYRRLPRSFLVEDGHVTTVWNGLPPLGSLSSSSPTSR
jgi:uncharacterized membrane protein YphA (DoxX/SURF4 family)